MCVCHVLHIKSLNAAENVVNATFLDRFGYFRLKGTFCFSINSSQTDMDLALERHLSELVARERSGHTAVVEDNLLYVWGGYMVRKTNT